MKGGTICSGILAPECAMPWVDWKWCAEIERFPCAVIAQRHPNVLNLGDVTAVDFIERALAVSWIDFLVAGTPCQAFSVAGLRKSMQDSRGNITLRLVEIVHAIRPRVLLWENVPGVLSTRDNAFGCFLAGLVGADEVVIPENDKPSSKRWRTVRIPIHRRRDKETGEWIVLKWKDRRVCSWTSAGVVAGPLGTAAWRILDAQYFGLAQRRARLFLVFCFGDGTDPAEILFEFESLRRDTPPSRETGQSVTGTLSARTEGGGGLGTDFDLGGGIIQDTPSQGQRQPSGGQPDLHPRGIPMPHNGGGQMRIDGESETFITGPLQAGGEKAAGSATQQDAESNLLVPEIAPCLTQNYGKQPDNSDTNAGPMVIAETLRSHPRPGSYTTGPIIPILESGARTGKSTDDIRAGIGIGADGDPMFTLQSGKQHAIGFYANDSGSDAGDDISPTLRSMELGGQNCPAVAFKPSYFTRGKDGAPSDIVPPLSADADKGDQDTVIAFSSKDHGADAGELAPTLRGMGHDGSHANGGGQIAVCFDTTQITSKQNRNNPKAGDPCHPLAAGAHPPAVAFRASGQEGFTPDTVTPPLTSTDGGRTVPSVAFQEAQTGVREYNTAGTLRSNGPGHDPVGTRVRSGMAVRRLTTVECARLQGFEDDWTQITYREQACGRWSPIQGLR